MLPEPDASEYGVMPAGRHPGSLVEVRHTFVSGAPYSGEREAIWQAFLVWESRLRREFPTATLWLNGGFVTHKRWAAPKDIDVFVMARQSESERFDWTRRAEFFTTKDAAGNRIQPIAGMVDAHFGMRGDAPVIVYFDDWWQKVTGENGEPVPRLRKGYVEVKP